MEGENVRYISHQQSSQGHRSRRGDKFGEFPPQQQLSAGGAYHHGTPDTSSTPQTSNKRADPQSVRFTKDTRLSPTRSNPVLVLDGSHSASSHRKQSSASESPFILNSPPQETTNSLDFSMITTPGGKQHARLIDNEGKIMCTPSDITATTAATSSSRWATGTPFSSLLRGVVSSTPSINPRQILASSTPYTAARESLNNNQQHTSNNNNNNTADESNECTALMFARSAPLSGYLRKLGKNIPTFKRRFFVLKPSTHLYYFMSPNDVEPRGCIDLDMAKDGEGTNGGCELREVGVFPDGTFRFELLFDEEASLGDDGSASILDDTASDTASRTSQGSSIKSRRQFQRQSIVLEARTEEIGREWMARLQSERLSVVRDEVDYLQTSLTEMTAISTRWEKSACEEAMRADGAERQRNTAISEAKVWEGKFTDLNEAVKLLVKSNKQGGASSEFLEEAFDGLDLNGTHFSDISEMYKLVSNREEEANERVQALEKSALEAESRAAKAEAELAKVWEDNRTMQNDLKKTRREKKVLVKEVRSLHAAAEENAAKQAATKQQLDDMIEKQKQHDLKQQHDLQSDCSQSARSRGGTASDSASFVPRPKRKLNDVETRLVIELEEHVMSGLRLSEQFLTLNGIDPSEVGDDLDDSVQLSVPPSSKASIDRSPERQTRYHSSQKQASHDLSPHPTSNQIHASKPLGSLLDESEDESESTLVYTEAGSSLPGNSAAGTDQNSASASFIAESAQGSDLLNDIYRYEEAFTSGEPVNQNLNDRFREQIHIDTPGQPEVIQYQQRNIQSTSHSKSHSTDRAPPSLDAASSVSESSRSRVTDNGHATAKLECPLRDVGETPHHHRSQYALGDDGKVYHITFYSSKIGLQFQKIPNETKAGGLLTDALTADHGPNVESNQTAAELRRIATISQTSQSRNRRGDQTTECLPVAPTDAVLVCGFVGFDSTNNVPPRIGGK